MVNNRTPTIAGLLACALHCLLCLQWSAAHGHPVQDDRSIDAERRQKEIELNRSDLDFRLSGLDGRSYSLSSFINFKEVTFVSVSEKCDSTEIIDWVERQPISKSRKFVLIDSGLAVDRPKYVDQWKAEKRKSLLLWDSLQILSLRLGFTTPGDFFSVSPKDGKLLSTGNASKLLGLKAEHKIADCSEPPHRGLSPNFSSAEFSEQFAKPFINACVRCHSYSEQLDYFKTLKDVHGWQAMSRKTMEIGRMPSGYEPNPHGESILNYSLKDLQLVYRYLRERRTSDKNQEKIYENIYRDEIENQIATAKRNLGKPDLVLNMKKPISVRATGDLIYKYVMLSEKFNEEKIVKAVVMDSPMTVVHHAHVIVMPNSFDEKQAVALETGDASAAMVFKRIYGDSISRKIRMTANGKSIDGIRLDQPIAATFSRPNRYSILNGNEGVRIPKGSYLAVILHIESTGKEEVEQSKFSFYFAPNDQPRKLIDQFTLVPSALTIPSEKVVVVRSEAVIHEHIQLERALVHMHYRGSAARIFVQQSTADGKYLSSPVLVADLPYHLFKMQTFYRFKDLTLLPGSKIITELVFDNTSANVANPYPDRAVKIGKASLDDEMHFPRIYYSHIQPQAQPRNEVRRD